MASLLAAKTLCFYGPENKFLLIYFHKHLGESRNLKASCASVLQKNIFPCNVLKRSSCPLDLQLFPTNRCYQQGIKNRAPKLNNPQQIRVQKSSPNCIFTRYPPKVEYIAATAIAETTGLAD